MSSLHVYDGRDANGSRDRDNEEQIGEDIRHKRTPWGKWIETRMDWSWFTCTQSTGGIAIVLAECPKQFDGLQTIGIIIFILNIVLWLVFSSVMVIRWIMYQRTFRKCFTEPPECYFYGSFWLSVATMIVCMQRFGVPRVGEWLLVVIRVLFWVYAAVTFLNATVHLVIICRHTPIVAIEMNPAWFLMIFNVMLTGTIAASIAMTQPPSQRMPIIVAGVGYQGLGWVGSIFFLAWFIANLLEKGWPEPSHRPGLFMTVGSAGYTIVALIGAARAIPEGYTYFATHPTAKEVLQIVATWVGVFLWVLTLWLFGIALFVCLAEVIQRRNGKWVMPMKFNNTWWSFIFPNVGFTLATAYLGQELESNTVLWVSVAMILVLVAFWLFDLCFMAKTIVESLFFDSRTKLT